MKKLLLVVICIALFLGFGQTLFAQLYEIRGRVLSLDDKLPLSNVVIRIIDNKNMTGEQNDQPRIYRENFNNIDQQILRTNSMGYFSILLNEDSTNILEFSHPLYETLELTCHTGETLDVRMSPTKNKIMGRFKEILQLSSEAKNGILTFE